MIIKLTVMGKSIYLPVLEMVINKSESDNRHTQCAKKDHMEYFIWTLLQNSSLVSVFTYYINI